MKKITLEMLMKAKEKHIRHIRKYFTKYDRSKNQDLVYILACRIISNAILLVETGAFADREYEALFQAMMAEESTVHPELMNQLVCHLARVFGFSFMEYFSYTFELFGIGFFDNPEQMTEAEYEDKGRNDSDGSRTGD